MAVLGSLSFDHLERGETSIHSLGGALTYSGLSAAKLGWKVHALAHVPRDLWPCCTALEKTMKCCWLDSKDATRFHNREYLDAQGNSHREQRMTSASQALRPDEFLHWMTSQTRPGRFDWIHLGPLFPRDFSDGLLPVLRARAHWLSADLQGWSRSIEEGRVRSQWCHPDDLGALDWVKASEEEWSTVREATGWSAKDALKINGWKGVLISAGVRGGCLYTHQGEIPWKAAPAGRTAMETGAGDVFTAAFVSAAWLLTKGLTGSEQLSAELLSDCLTQAADVAAAHVAAEWLDMQELQF